MVGNENLWSIGNNIFLPANLNFNSVQLAKKSAPESGYVVGAVAAFIKKTCANSANSENQG